MASTVPARELRTHTADVLRRVRAGDHVMITQNGVPVATMVPIDEAKPPMPKATLLSLLARSRIDPGFAADVAALTDGTTDDLGPLT